MKFEIRMTNDESNPNDRITNAQNIRIAPRSDPALRGGFGHSSFGHSHLIRHWGGASFVIRHFLLIGLLLIFMAADAPTTTSSRPEDARPPALLAAMAAAATQPSATQSSPPQTDDSLRTVDSFRSSRYSSRSSRYSSRSSSGYSNNYSRDTRSTYSPPGDDLLLQKSIFSRDRRPARTYDTTASSSSSQPRPPTIPVLVGIIHEDDGFVAYLEDPDTGHLWPFAIGDALPSDAGTVRDISIDSMNIAKNADDPPKRIDIGYNLHGDRAGSTTTTYSPSASTATTDAATTAAAADLLKADPSTLSLEQQMKLKRLKQLNK
ncbi:MAG: hypothetical protein FWD61_02575 [Phycisphaerales bacterium]|nr:hypothetical protein [Phycisphaerales bacterium]